MLRRFLLFLLLGCCGGQAAAAAPVPQALLTPGQLQQDLAFLKAAIANTHPDPGFSADAGKLAAAFSDIGRQFTSPMTRDQAWRVLAPLNPVFADGHLQVAIPDWREQVRAHLKAGRSLFPFATQVDGEGGMRIRSGIDGSATAFTRQRIVSVNGVPAAELTRAMLALTPGDTPQLQANLLSRRMWLTYWKLYGAPGNYDLVLEAQGRRQAVRVPGARVEPEGTAAANFQQQFKFELLSGGAALLTVNDFMTPDKPAFYAFMRQAFEDMKKANTTTLLIDVRHNTGGDDDMWKQGILPYIADRPYRHASSYIKKVIAGRASGSEQVGDVVEGTADSWVQAEPGNPLRFAGKVYVLVGRLTYSSAILFSNVMQDFGFGTLVGERGYARARQSGGIQVEHILPNTRLEIVVPRFVLDRPSGKRQPALLEPDLVLEDDPFDKSQLVRTLLGRLDAGAPTAPAGALPAAPRP